MQTLELSGGYRMPALGLGTWKADPGVVGEAVREAVRIGYRHFDCAPVYGNEREVGLALSAAIAAGEVRREELWITSKLWNDCHGRDNVLPALGRTLNDLKLDYLDLFLVHWPLPQRPGVSFPAEPRDFLDPAEAPLADTWAGMEDAVGKGMVRCIGVSNFSRRRLEDLGDQARVSPAVLQVELHPYLAQAELVDYCRSRGIGVTAYSPLGSKDRPERLQHEDEPVLLEDTVIRSVARRHSATPAQVLVAWALARGTSVIPKSSSPVRLKENFAAAGLRLDERDMQDIAALDRGYRYVDGAFWCFEGSPHTLESLWG
ncbi:MAG: aldo/keto reductase [Gammaproteobacteria bacterium]